MDARLSRLYLTVLADLQASQGDWRPRPQGRTQLSRRLLEVAGEREGRQERDETRKDSRRIPLARLYHVFNVQQCELPERLQPLLKRAEPQSPAPHAQIPACEQILANMPNRPSITHNEARAYWVVC